MFKNAVAVTGSLEELVRFEDELVKEGYTPFMNSDTRNYIVTYYDGDYHYIAHEEGDMEREVFTLPQDFDKALEAIKERI